METENIKTKSTKKIIKKFSDLQFSNDNEEGHNFNNIDSNLDVLKMNIEVLNYDDVYEQFNDLIFNKNKKFETNQNEFFKTKYADNGAFNDFYSKLHKSEEFARKEILPFKTPSFNFIDSTKKYKLIPNPVGLLKRDGEEHKVMLKYLILYIYLLI